MPEENLEDAIQELQHEGGTVRAATEIQHKYKSSEPKPAKPKLQDKSLQSVAAMKIRDFWKTYNARYRDRMDEISASDFYTALLEWFEEGM